MTSRFADMRIVCKAHAFPVAVFIGTGLLLLLAAVLADPLWAANDLTDVGTRTYKQTSGFAGQIYKAVLIVGALWWGCRGRWGHFTGFIIGMCLVGVAVFGADGLSTLLTNIGHSIAG